jgi:hypothetical protein
LALPVPIFPPRARGPRRGLLLALSVAAMLTTGCGRKGPDVVEVTGRITKGGKPVSFVTVSFMPERGRTSVGRTDADGRYDLDFSKEIPKGAVPGRHKVYFAVSQERIDAPVNLKESKYHPQMAQILKKFGSYQTTPCQVEVTHSSPEVNIELDDY